MIFDSWGKLPRGGRLFGHGGYTPAMRITRAWRVAPAWVRELIDEIDGVKKVGVYWVNRVSGMGIRSPFTFDHVARILRFKGFQTLYMKVRFLIIPRLILTGVLFVFMKV